MQFYEIRPNVESMDFNEIISEFKANGFAVTEQALKHNYDAWRSDYKSGYADPENGYFLFSACGCNDLYFYAERYTGEDYQHTYEA